MDGKTFTKMSALVDQEFTVEKVWGFKYKLWDKESGKMLTSDTWQQGYQKKYSIDTDKGSLDMSAGQFANMLEGVSKDGKSDVNGRTFHIKSNGKTGMDIRYYINPVFKKTEPLDIVVDGEPFNLDDVPY